MDNGAIDISWRPAGANSVGVRAVPPSDSGGRAKTGSNSNGARLEVTSRGGRLLEAGITNLCNWLLDRAPATLAVWSGQQKQEAAWIDLRGSAIGDRGVACLVDCLETLGVEAERLWLDASALGIGSLAPLQRVVAKSTFLDLRLTDNGLDDEVVFSLLTSAAGGAARRGVGAAPTRVALARNALRDPATLLERLRQAGIEASLGEERHNTSRADDGALRLLLPSFCEQPLNLVGGPGGRPESQERRQANTEQLIDIVSALTDVLGNATTGPASNSPAAEHETEPAARQGKDPVPSAADWDPYMATDETQQEIELTPAIGVDKALGDEVASALAALKGLMEKGKEKGQEQIGLHSVDRWHEAAFPLPSMATQPAATAPGGMNPLTMPALRPVQRMPQLPAENISGLRPSSPRPATDDVLLVPVEDLAASRVQLPTGKPVDPRRPRSTRSAPEVRATLSVTAPAVPAVASTAVSLATLTMPTLAVPPPLSLASGQSVGVSGVPPPPAAPNRRELVPSSRTSGQPRVVPRKFPVSGDAVLNSRSANLSMQEDGDVAAPWLAQRKRFRVHPPSRS